jgi:hypothetical protein
MHAAISEFYFHGMTHLTDSAPNPAAWRVEVLSGHAKVVAWAEQLEHLALRCGQPGSMHGLEHFLAVPTYRGKVPYLVLGMSEDRTLQWAVLCHELCPLGLRTGIFSTDDISGFRTVVSPAEERGSVSRLVAEILLERGAQMVMLSVVAPGLSPQNLGLQPALPSRWALRERTVEADLSTQGSYEAMLMGLGKSTRFNMRYYRRRLARELQTELIEDARGIFTEREIESMNAESLNPFRPGLAWLQCRSASSMRGGFMVGLRAKDGRWLGLVGGWRQATTTVLLWQMNRSGMERSSLGTVVRGHFLEHEIAIGAERVIFYGGTPNSIRHAFVQDKVVDLLVVRHSGKARLLLRLAEIFARPRWYMKSGNFLAATFCSPDLVWHENGSDGKQLKS